MRAEFNNSRVHTIPHSLLYAVICVPAFLVVYFHAIVMEDACLKPLQKRAGQSSASLHQEKQSYTEHKRQITQPHCWDPAVVCSLAVTSVTRAFFGRLSVLRRWSCGEAARSLLLWFGASVPWRVETSVPQWFDLPVSNEEGAYWRRLEPSRFLQPTLSRWQ